MREFHTRCACLAIKSNNPIWLEDRNTNITTKLASIFKIFSDFRLVAQIREEIEKVNQINTLLPALA